MNLEIGAFEAKAKLSALLREVEKGNRFTITVRGRPIADLVPSESLTQPNTDKAIEEMLSIRKIKGINKETLLQWISEGRK